MEAAAAACAAEFTGRSATTSDGPVDDGIDLSRYFSPVEVEELGADALKAELQRLGLKCGGTLQERAKRLFATKVGRCRLTSA